MALEKTFMRLTSMPKAAEVRPLFVLKDAFELVLRRWDSERDYLYACEQLKAIRQDLTVQQHTTEGRSLSGFSVRVYEAHARIALISSDFDEYAQCQSQLVILHAATPPVVDTAAGAKSSPPI